MAIDGVDPLLPLIMGVSAEHGGQVGGILDDAVKGQVDGVLSSYTGFFDVFSEMIQNALDATQKRARSGDEFQPRIWIEIDIGKGIVRVVDNGTGMAENEFLLCFCPYVSFKRGEDLRGKKGVGATFLAYGYNYIHLQSKVGESRLSAVLRQGRQWVEDRTNRLHRPKFEETTYAVPELTEETAGTVFEVRLSGAGGEKPKDLGWHGATTAAQWFDILRLVTPLGGVYIDTESYKPEVHVRVLNRAGLETTHSSTNVEYFYPHEIPTLKAVDLGEIRTAIKGIEGDPQTILTRLPDKYKRLECVYEVWTHEEILSANGVLKLSLSDDQRILIERHQIGMYAAHVDSVKTFDAFNDSLGLRKNSQVMRGGLQLAAAHMPQGDLLVIPLNRFIGYQRNTHVVVHFSNGSPDLGRKVFQPELRTLAEALAVSATNLFIGYRWLMKPDTGSTRELVPSRELHRWRRSQEDWRDQNPFAAEVVSPTIGYLSKPREEQDVVALFHELIGAGVIRGLRFYGSTFNDTYDALVELVYTDADRDLFDASENPLGVRKDLPLPYESEPKVLEYKFDLDSLIRDFDAGVKFPEHVDLVVCWQATGTFKRKLMLQSLLLGDAGDSRVYFGATHKAYMQGEFARSVFEVIILEDLYNFLLDPEAENARQRTRYELD